MEFGEKLKRAREEKGLTQQSLAERLFVTRQAVSRWENGARYPDILTAKKLADLLEVSLDELLSQEDPKKIVARTPVIEDRAASGLQAAVYVMTAVPYVMQVLAMLWESGIGTGSGPASGWEVTQMLIEILCMGMMVCAATLSISGKMDPKMICIVTGAYFFTGWFARFVSAVLSRYAPTVALCVIMFLGYLLVAVMTCRYYLAPKRRSPAWMYLFAGTLLAYSLVSFGGQLWFYYWRGRAWTDILFYVSMIRFFCNSSFAALMFVQARAYDRKRRLAEQEGERDGQLEKCDRRPEKCDGRLEKQDAQLGTQGVQPKEGEGRS